MERTMVRRQLDERQWSKVEAVLISQRGVGRRARDDRNFIEAVLWWRQTGMTRAFRPRRGAQASRLGIKATGQA
jgi:hypothetical protein